MFKRVLEPGSSLERFVECLRFISTFQKWKRSDGHPFCPQMTYLGHHVLKFCFFYQSHMPPHAQPPLRKWPQLDSLVMDFSPKPSLSLHFYNNPWHFPWKVTFSFWAFPGQFCFDFVFFVRLLAGKACFYFPKKHDLAKKRCLVETQDMCLVESQNMCLVIRELNFKGQKAWKKVKKGWQKVTTTGRCLGTT